MMNRRNRIFSALALALFLLTAAPPMALRADEPVKQDLKQAGKEIGRAGKAVGEKVTSGAKQAAQGAPQVAETTWQKTKRNSRRFWSWLTGKKEKKD
jgi:X-X-X-Leu-X-X-Gly heptad repeat protein